MAAPMSGAAGQQRMTDVGALKAAHAHIEDTSEDFMRGLLRRLLTASAQDKPSCFVAVRVARAMVEEMELQGEHEDNATDVAERAGNAAPQPAAKGGKEEGADAAVGLVAAERQQQRGEPDAHQSAAATSATEPSRDEAGSTAGAGAGATDGLAAGASSGRLVPDPEGGELHGGADDAQSDATMSPKPRSTSSAGGSRRGPGSQRKQRQPPHGRESKRVGAAAAAAAASVAGDERFLAPVQRLTQSARRERARQQRHDGAVQIQRCWRGATARRPGGGCSYQRVRRACVVLQRWHRHRVWRYALAQAEAARARKRAELEAAAAARAAEAAQREGFEAWARGGGAVNVHAIPEELRREELLHCAQTQLGAAARGMAARRRVAEAHGGWRVGRARERRAREAERQRRAAGAAAEQRAHALEEAERREALEAAERERERARELQQEKEHTARMRRARADILAKQVRGRAGDGGGAGGWAGRG
jgi:hypothetical protein